MKYIVVVIDGHESMFVFPRTINHDAFAEGIEGIRFGGSRDWTRKLINAKKEGLVISAGFITNGECHGRSESLNIDGRGNVDTILFKASMAQGNV